jgi:hypothetical protein
VGELAEVDDRDISRFRREESSSTIPLISRHATSASTTSEKQIEKSLLYVTC